MCVLVAKLCQTLQSHGRSLPDSSVYGILQIQILEWVAIFSSMGIFLTQGLNPCLMSPALAGGLFTADATREAPEINVML